ncbi:hypothetical protein RhiirA1_534294 [Rhizophagus irregularis]|uniref:Uncharacterized protein n=1 Tax=Rhizophagus irregularis TaxID=588596 RepID=A0A2N0RYE6_9GLOM|nr:hypothetical protein RhiirA1_534294 [Rhizophagus irregularis]CAB4471147.1 unnamed protein product [Rhizophagus irregularis]
MTMKASSTIKMQNVFKEKIEVLKEETSNLIEEIAGYAGDGNTNEFLRSLGNLESKLKDTMDSLSNRADEVEKELKELKDQVNYMKFFSDYRDWASIFIQMLTKKLGGVDNWHGVEMEDEDIGLNLTDIKLLLEVRDASNILIHKKNQTSRDAEMELGTYPVPDNLKIYKPPLKKAYKAMSRWRSS